MATGLGRVANRVAWPAMPTLWLDVPQRVQLGEVGCGLYALGMAMDFWSAHQGGGGAQAAVALVSTMDATIGARDTARAHHPQPTTDERMLETSQALGLTGYGECYAAYHLMQLALHFGYGAKLHRDATLGTLLEVLESGRPAIVCIDIDTDTFECSDALGGQHTHFVVVGGYHRTADEEILEYLLLQQSGKRAPERTIWPTELFLRSWSGASWGGRYRRRRLPREVAARLRVEGGDGQLQAGRLLFDAEAPALDDVAAAALHAELASPAVGLLELAGEGRVRLAEGAELHHAHELRQLVLEVWPAG